MCDSFYGSFEIALEWACSSYSYALEISTSYKRYRCDLISYSAWYHLFPAYLKVTIFWCSNGILSAKGMDIILKEMKEEGGG